MSKCFKGAKLSKTLDDEKEIVFNITREKLDFKNEFHRKIMLTVYKILTQSNECPFVGEHWVTIGFQGNNPKTDLRGVGMYGMLQLLAFCEKYPEYSREILQHSGVKGHEYPMVSLFLNFTFITLEGLKWNKFIRTCNKKKALNVTLNEFYFGMITYFFEIYKKSNYTIHEVSGLLKDIEKVTRKNPELIFNKFIK